MHVDFSEFASPGESRAQPREPVPCEEEELQGDQPESPTLDASFRLSAACARVEGAAALLWECARF